MKSAEWKFKDDAHMGVLCLTQIMNREAPVLFVAHDAEDGMWQFLDGSTPREEDAVIAHLHQLVELDPTLHDLHDLPLGSVAWRDSVSSPWTREVKPAGATGV